MGGSDDDTGRFEFGQSADSTGEDPPDQPDPPDPDSGGEPTASTEPSKQEPSNEPPNEPRRESNEEATADAASGGSAAADSQQQGGDDGAASADRASSTSESGSGNDSGSDAPDPPDPSDGSSSSSSGFEFDPVTESRKAFEFAEKQSRAAAESAYSRAKQTWFWKVLKRYTSPEVRERLDEVFSRRMLGSVLVGGAFTKIIESGVEMLLGASGIWRPVMWTSIFVLSTVIFVWWEQLSRRASEAAEKASEAASEAAEKASETASEAAEKASETASEATGAEPPESEERPAGVVGAEGSQAAANREGGATAATRAGGKRPSAVRSRSRAPDRRANKRFANGDEPGVDAVELGDDEASELVYEGAGFQNPGRDEPAQGR